MHSSRVRTARALPYGGVSLTETPRQTTPLRKPPWTELHPPERETPQTETYPGQRPPGHVTCGTCWDRDPPVNRHV